MSNEPESRYAVARNDVFSKYLHKPKNGPGFLTSFSLLRVIEDLTAGGSTTGDAVVFLEMIWLAGEGLDRGVPTPLLAKSLGRMRTSVARSIRNLKKQGLIREKSPQVYRYVTGEHIDELRNQAGNPRQF